MQLDQGKPSAYLKTLKSMCFLGSLQPARPISPSKGIPLCSQCNNKFIVKGLRIPSSCEGENFAVPALHSLPCLFISPEAATYHASPRAGAVEPCWLLRSPGVTAITVLGSSLVCVSCIFKYMGGKGLVLMALCYCRFSARLDLRKSP